jgi:3',5'-cyclic AMP phosphodiesterase CpdA
VRILHFSDPHVQLPRWRERPLREFGPLRAIATAELWKGRGRSYDQALEKLRQIVRDAETLRADLVVCTGDLTQLGMEEEFALAREALAPLGERLVCIPGNHDRYPLDGRPSALYEAYFPPRALPPGFAALDSCGAVCWPVITQGRIVEAELAQDFRGKVVLLHHAPFRGGGVPDWPWHRLRGARKLLEAAREAAAILCGHIHERFQWRNVICAGSSTERRKEGYWLLELVPGAPGPAPRAALYRPGAALVAAGAERL